MTQVRSPDGHVTVPNGFQLLVEIDDTDSPYDASPNEYVAVDASGGDVTVNFPTARAGGIFTVQVNAVGANNYSLIPQAGEEINGSAAGVLAATALGARTYRATRTAAGVFDWRSI